MQSALCILDASTGVVLKKRVPRTQGESSPVLFVKRRIDIARETRVTSYRVSVYPAERPFPRIFAKQETGLTLSHHPIHLDLYEYFYELNVKNGVDRAGANNRRLYVRNIIPD